MTPRPIVLLAVLATLSGAGRARGEEPPPEEAPAPKDAAEAEVLARGWLEDLSSDRFEVRDRARRALVKHGALARGVLEARRDDPDPEVRQAVRMALDPPASATPVEEPKGDLTNLALVDLATSGTAAEVTAALGALHGVRFVLPDSSREVPCEVAAGERPFFAHVGDLARALGLDASSPFDGAATLTLAPAPSGGAGLPWASAGPIRVRPVKVAATRSFEKPDERTFTLTLALHWSPGVEVVTYRAPRLVGGADPAGRTFKAGGTEPTVIYGVGQGTHAAEVPLALAPSEPTVEERAAWLDLAFVLRVRHQRRMLRFADLALPLPRTLDERGNAAEAGATGTVTLRSISRPEGERSPLAVEISARLPGEAGSQSLRGFAVGLGETRVPLLVTARSTSADGLTRFTGRAYNAPAEFVLESVEVLWFEREEEGAVRLRLEDVPLR